MGDGDGMRGGFEGKETRKEKNESKIKSIKQKKCVPFKKKKKKIAKKREGGERE